MTVYVVEYQNGEDPGGVDSVHATRESAEAEISRLRKEPCAHYWTYSAEEFELIGARLLSTGQAVTG